MRENRLHGSAGGEGFGLSRPLSTTEYTAAEPAVYPDIEILQSPRKSSAVSVGSTHFVKLSFLAKAASLAVYLDISPRYIQISVTGGISRYQPAAYDVLSRSYFLQPIGRTLYSPPATIQYMGVDHRSVDIFMAE